MQNDNLVSVIIPVYNSEKYLEECLDSILNQTYENIEIIAIDDGSEDSSLDILKKYSDKIRIFPQENQGLASSLNFGISKIKGIWIKWFSPDDVMYPYTIETLVDEIKKHDKDTILYSNWNIIDDVGNILREFQESNYNDLSVFQYNIRLLDGQQINVNTTLIPTHLFERCKIRELDDPVTIDYDFFLRSTLLYGTKFHLISKPLAKYRIHTDQLSHKNISKTLDYIEEIKNEILIQLDDSLQKNILMNYNYIKKQNPQKERRWRLV